MASKAHAYARRIGLQSGETTRGEGRATGSRHADDGEGGSWKCAFDWRPAKGLLANVDSIKASEKPFKIMNVHQRVARGRRVANRSSEHKLTAHCWNEAELKIEWLRKSCAVRHRRTHDAACILHHHNRRRLGAGSTIDIVSNCAPTTTPTSGQTVIFLSRRSAANDTFAQ